MAEPRWQLAPDSKAGSQGSALGFKGALCPDVRPSLTWLPAAFCVASFFSALQVTLTPAYKQPCFR